MHVLQTKFSFHKNAGEIQSSFLSFKCIGQALSCRVHLARCLCGCTSGSDAALGIWGQGPCS